MLIRLILRMLRIRDFDCCLGCATLKEQLVYERSQNKELIETLVHIVNPKTIVESEPAILSPTNPLVGTFSRRRAAAEARDKAEFKIKKESTLIGRPDDSLVSKTPIQSVEDLEKELGVESTEEKVS